jgi:hypothetical protein
VISAAIWYGESEFRPADRRKTTWIAVIIGVGVLEGGASRIVRNKGPAGLLVGPEDRIESEDVCRRRRLVFPERFTAFRLGGGENFRRSETPDGAGIHHHDAMRKWIEANIKFTVAYFRRRAGRRVKSNVTWRIWLGLIGTAKPGSTATNRSRK